jgi:glucokinase
MRSEKPAREESVLIADLGGTHSRFALLGASGRPAQMHVFSNDALADVEAGIGAYLERVRAKPRLAVLAVAGPVEGETIAFTNRAWRFTLGDLATRFGFARVHAVNDFEAVAWSLTRLGRGDVTPLAGAEAAAGHGAKVVFGPGTGLGVAALVPVGNDWTAVASEGGHASFGPATDAEQVVFARLRNEGPVSAETVLSGPGLARLHRARHPQGEALSPERCVARALAGDSAARASVALFIALLGRFAGDLALMFKATGGVYIAGGVARHLRPLIDARAFRAAFEAHPPYAALLASIPTLLITLEEPGLLGCGVIAERLARARNAR